MGLGDDTEAGLLRLCHGLDIYRILEFYFIR